jgi:predicted transcriptional regulator
VHLRSKSVDEELDLAQAPQSSRSPFHPLNGFVEPDQQSSKYAAREGVSHQQVQRLILVRQLRTSLIGRDLFADPAWDMLLGLYAADLAGRRVSTGELCSAVDVPLSTATRWISALVERGLIMSSSQNATGSIKLTPSGSTAMNRYFSTVAVALLPF